MVGIADHSSLSNREVMDDIISPRQKKYDSTSKDIVKSAKLNRDQADKLKQVQIMLGSTESDAIRWCIEAAWKEHGDRVQEIAEAKQKLGSISL